MNEACCMRVWVILFLDVLLIKTPVQLRSNYDHFVFSTYLLKTSVARRNVAVISSIYYDAAEVP